MLVAVLAACLLTTGVASAAPLERVLVFSETAGFRHDSIPAGITAIQELGAANGFAVDATEDSTPVQRHEPRPVPGRHLPVDHGRRPQRHGAGGLRALHRRGQRLRRHPRRRRHRVRLGLVRRPRGRYFASHPPALRPPRSTSRTPTHPPRRRFRRAGPARTSGTTTSPRPPAPHCGGRLQPAL